MNNAQSKKKSFIFLKFQVLSLKKSIMLGVMVELYFNIKFVGIKSD